MVVLRAIGPSLALSGVPGILADPLLELHDSTGAIVAKTTTGWINSADDQMVLTDNNLATPVIPPSRLSSKPLDPGEYTAIVSGVGGTTGIALVEVYDLDNGHGLQARQHQHPRFCRDR